MRCTTQHVGLLVLAWVLGGRMAAAVPVDAFSVADVSSWECKDNGSIQLVADPEDPGNRVLSFTYDLHGAGYCWVYGRLGAPLDGRLLLGVSCRLRAVDSADAVLQAVIKTGPEGTQQFQSTAVSFRPAPDGWVTAYYPFDGFKGLTPADLAHVRVVGFVMMRRGRDAQGSCLLDDISLVDAKDVAPSPELIAPENGVVATAAPALVWRAVPGAEGYTVAARRPGADRDELRRTLSSTTWVAESLPDGTWLWRVRAKGAGFVMGSWSKERELTVDTEPPTLLSVEALPHEIVVETDDRLRESDPLGEVRVDGEAVAVDSVRVDGRRCTLIPRDPVSAGRHRLTVHAVTNAYGRTRDELFADVEIPVVLARVEDRWEAVRKDLFVLARDRALMERQALGFGSELTSMLQAVPWIANAIDGNTASETFGWQASHRYRSSPESPTSWDKPSNARIMECIYAPLMAYTLRHPANPYFHDPAVRDRVVAALEFWLDLQGAEGGFPEYNGLGSQELPSTAFGMEFLIEMAKTMRADGTFPEGLTDRVVQAVERAAVWAATPGRASTIQGSYCTNQYCGALYGMWHLYRLTGDERWKAMYDAQLDDWLANGQELPYWYEANGVETFGYSRITEWELDRILIDNGDPRIVESLRRYYRWCALNTVVEMDESTFIMDNLGHARTHANGPGSGVGYCNHIATVLPLARAWTHGYTMTEEEREQRIRSWFAAEPPEDKHFPKSRRSSYNPFARTLFFEPKGFWTVNESERLEAVRGLPFLSSDSFTAVYHSERGGDHFLFARRPGHYTTFHWGRPDNKQAKDIGLIWVPGFGTLVRSTNVSASQGYATARGGQSTYRQSIELLRTRVDDEDRLITDSAGAADLSLAYGFESPRVERVLSIQGERVGITVSGEPGLTERIPLYLRSDDRVTVDGAVVTWAPGETASFHGRRVLIERRCGGRTGRAVLAFESMVHATATPGYTLAGGTVWVVEVPVPPARDLVWWVGRASE